MGAVMSGETPHLTYRCDIDLRFSPLLALDQFLASVLAHDEVDAAVGAAKPSLLDGVAALPESFPHQQLEFPPAQGAKGLQTRLRCQELPALAAFEVGGDRANPAEGERHPGEGSELSFGQLLSQLLCDGRAA